MRKTDVARILRKKYDAYCEQVVGIIKALPSECRQSGDDSPLENVWEEFKCQVQGEEAWMFDAYVETIKAICHQVATSLADHELELLWLDSEAYFDHDDGAPLPHRDQLIEGVEAELYQRVFNRAEDEELAADSDEDPGEDEEPEEVLGPE